MKVGHKYYGHGAYVKVVKVTNDVAEVVWGHNGSIPKRDGDRYWRKPLWDGFVEVVFTTPAPYVRQLPGPRIQRWPA